MRRVQVLVLTGAVALLLWPAAGRTQLPQFQPSGGGQPGMGGFPGRGGPSRGDPSQLWEMMAQGKDSVSRNQIDPRMQGMFDRMAERMGVTNGVMTKQQFSTYMEQRAAERANGGGPPGMGGPPGSLRGTPGAPGAPTPDNRSGPSADAMNGWAESQFRRYDRNGDGYLNNDEMPEALRIERDKWDADHNGLIDLTEFKGFFQGRMQQMQAERSAAGGFGPGSQDGAPDEEDKKPVVYRSGNLPKEIPDWFRQADLDGDAQIGLYEWKNTGKPLDLFHKMDRNGDGFVTVDEVMRYVALYGGGETGSPGFGGLQGFAMGAPQNAGDFSTGGRPPMMMMVPPGMPGRDGMSRNMQYGPPGNGKRGGGQPGFEGGKKGRTPGGEGSSKGYGVPERKGMKDFRKPRDNKDGQ